jgi:Flp pilus assembly pilin Flp
VKSLMQRMWKDQEGVLTFEWILLITVVTIGVVGGLSAVRDAVISELGDVAEAMISLDQSYSIIHPVEAVAHDNALDGAVESFFIDTNCNRASSCRAPQPPAYGQQVDRSPIVQ